VKDLGGNINGWSQIVVFYVVENGSSRLWHQGAAIFNTHEECLMKFCS